MGNRLAALLLGAMMLAGAGGAVAGDGAAEWGSPPPAGPEDLTLGDFFSTGWKEPWKKRARGEGTPDGSLLRVQTNFLSQLFRLDLARQENRGGAAARANDLLTGTLEYAFNRRLMLGVIGNYRWLDERMGEDREGGALAMFARVQLAETAHSSLAGTVRAGFPSRELDEKQTTLGFAVAGWQDLAPLGLGRTGLYYHVQEETQMGPGGVGERRNSATYDLSLATTWTSPEAMLGNLTTFVEAYGRTDLDGDERGRTVLTLTPGVRATIAHRHVVMAGVELPVSEEKPYDRVVRLAYMYCF